MTYDPFFPGTIFGWTFYLVLVGICITAAVVDFRELKVPKWITLPMLALGVVFNVGRGIWLGAVGEKTWVISSVSPVTGGLDGLLFALAGFGVGFALFFVLWVLNICGGGDVKLFAALGAWVGPEYALWIMVGSVAVMGAAVFLRIAAGSLKHGPMKTIRKMQSERKRQHEKTPKKTSPSRLMTYSLPLAVSTAVVLLWFFRVDLRLAPVPAERGPVSQNATP